MAAGGGYLFAYEGYTGYSWGMGHVDAVEGRPMEDLVFTVLRDRR